MIFHTGYYLLKMIKLPNFTFKKINMHISHLAFVILIFAVITNHVMKFEKEVLVEKNQEIELGDFKVKLVNFLEGKKDNYYFFSSEFLILDGYRRFYLYPEKRFYIASEITTKETDIKRDFLTDIYIVIGEIYEGNRIKIRFIYNPFINLIWFSFILLLLPLIFSKFSKNEK